MEEFQKALLIKEDVSLHEALNFENAAYWMNGIL